MHYSAARPGHPAYFGHHSHGFPGFRVSNKVRHGAGKVAITRGRHGATSAVAAAAVGLLGLAAVSLNQRWRERRRKQMKQRQVKVLQRKLEKLKQKPLDSTRCNTCREKQNTWMATSCGMRFCSSCVVNGFLGSHIHIYRSKNCKFFCESVACSLVPLEAPDMDAFEGQYFLTGEEESGDTITKTFVNLAQLQGRQAPKRLLVCYRKSDNSVVDLKRRSPLKKISPLRFSR
jgi:hypothetical protein